MMNDLITHADLNISPLGSYDMLIGMDWLEKDQVMLNCFDKTFTCTDDNGNTVKVKGIPKKVRCVTYVCGLGLSIICVCCVHWLYVCVKCVNNVSSGLLYDMHRAY